MKIYGFEIPFVYLKWFIIVLTLTLILGLIVWIVCGFYIFKWFKISINNYNFYLNEYHTDCADLLKKYGNYPIKRIYLVRHPITKFMETCLNLVTLYKFKQEVTRYKKKNNNEAFFPFHTMLYVELKISKNKSKFLLIDKNNCVRISTKLKILNEYEMRDIRVKKYKYTLNEVMEKTRKRIGNNKFFNWELYKNNCQILIKEILITLKKFTKTNEKFMCQNGFAKEIKISEFSLHIIRSLTNSMNLLENVVGTAIWMPG